jgi:hypothetical protein
MVVNRYTNYQPAKYTPRTLQELMIAPAYMIQQHDTADERIALAQTALAQVDNLDLHDPVVQQEQQRLNQQLQQQAEMLNSEGFNSSTKGNFLRFNKDYQGSIGPNGLLGQSIEAKKIYNTNQTEFLASAAKEGIGSDRALELWKEKTANYTGFDNQNRITNVEKQGVAAKQDYEQDLSRINSLLGSTTTSEKSRGVSIVEQALPDGTTMFVAKNKSGATVESSNVNQLNDAKKAHESKWHDPKGEGFLYAKDAGLNITQERTNNMFSAMLKESSIDQTSESIQFLPKAIAENSIDPKGTIMSNDSTITSDALSQPKYADAISEIKNLENLSKTSNLSSLDRSRLEDLSELKANAEVKMLKDPSYLVALNEYNSAKENIPEVEHKMFSYINGGIDGYDTKRVEAVNKLREKENALNEIQNKYWTESSSLRHNYSYVPSTTKEVSEWDIHNENVYNALRSVDNLGNVLDLTSINTTGGTSKNLDKKDVDNIQNLIKTSDPKSFKINNIKTYGDNKTPEITMTFNTLEGSNEYDTKGISWDDEYGGSGKPMTVTFKLKKFSNAGDTGSAPGYKNLTGIIGEFWKDKGGINAVTGNFQGNEVYTALIQNSYLDVSNSELYQRAQVDSDAKQVFINRAIKRGITPSQLIDKYSTDTK